MIIHRIAVLLSWLASIEATLHAAPPSTNLVLIIDRSSSAVSGGKATLSIGPLTRTADIYAGEYQMKVSPYFFKNEKGRLAIIVSDDALAQVRKGTTVEITGTATRSDGGKTRRIDATATPSDNNRGTLQLWFIASDRKMVFEPAYHFAGNEAASIQKEAKSKSK